MIYINIREEVTTVLVKYRISHLCGALMFILRSQDSNILKCCKYKWATIVSPSTRHMQNCSNS